MKKESLALRMIKNRYTGIGIDPDRAFHKAKLLLKVYRDVVWSVEEHIDSINNWGYEMGSKDLKKGLDFLSDFAPDIDKEKFETEVSCVFESQIFIELIDKALLKVKEYPDNGDLYFDILYKQYILKYKYTEKEILDVLTMERSVFYNRKSEAMNLFGVALWGCAIPEFRKLTIGPKIYRPNTDLKPT